MEKKFCSIHHVFYVGNHCPYCLAESSRALSEKFNTKVTLKAKFVNKKNDKITESDLEALKAKFNSK